MILQIDLISHITDLRFSLVDGMYYGICNCGYKTARFYHSKTVFIALDSHKKNYKHDIEN